MALKVTQAWLDKVELRYPGFRESVDRYEARETPKCPTCGSDLTGVVASGIVGYSISLAAATTKLMLLPNREDHKGKYFCHGCRTFFDESGTTYDQLAQVTPSAREKVEAARNEGRDC